jgi:phosphatidylglycerophosphatase A
LVALFLFYPLTKFTWQLQLTAILILFVIAFWSVKESAPFQKKEDDQRIVIDEFLGQWIALFTAPQNWVYFGIAFLLFRTLDILKPYPANFADRRWKGAKGVLMDDVFAGIYSLAILRALERIWLQT